MKDEIPFVTDIKRVVTENKPKEEYLDIWRWYLGYSLEKARAFEKAVRRKLEKIMYAPFSFTTIYRVREMSRIRWADMKQYKVIIFFSPIVSKRIIKIHSISRYGRGESKIPGYKKGKAKYLRNTLREKTKGSTGELAGAIRRASSKLRKMQAIRRRKS